MRPSADDETDRPTIAYFAGPIDADHVRRCFEAGVDDETYYGTRYLTQFYEVCRRVGADAHVVAPTTVRRRSTRDDIEYWRVPLAGRSGILYHLGQVVHLARFAARSVAIGADIVVVVPSPPYWFVLGLLRLFGIAVVPSAHRVLWPRFGRPTAAQTLFLRLTSLFLARGCGPVLVVSDDVADQIRELTGGRKPAGDLLEFRPTYDPEHFPDADHGADPPARTPGEVLRVLFVGRIERDKGVFLLLDVAERFAATSRHDIVFDICGSGSAADEVRRRIDDAGLAPTVRFHGYCDRAAVAARYQACDVVVVPTTTDFVEGFNKVVAEAVLWLRPVVTSAVCPALHAVEDAAVVVPPDRPGPYADALLRLADEPGLLAASQAACGEVRQQFFDDERSWGHHFEVALGRLPRRRRRLARRA